MTKTITIKTTPEAARIVGNVLDFYARIGLGQFNVISELARFGQLVGEEGRKPSLPEVERAEEYLTAAKYALTGFPSNASHGIYSPHVPLVFKQAYHASKAIRHRLAWDSTPEGGLGVHFDEPLRGEEGTVPFEVSSTESEEALLASVPENIYIGRTASGWRAVVPHAESKSLLIIGESHSLETVVQMAKNYTCGQPARSFAF
jgi:hypothetical protein